MPALFERIRPPEEFAAGIEKEQLQRQLSEMGLPPGASLMIHSSLRAIGKIKGGARTVIDALCGSLDGGTLYIPVCTYDTVDAEHNIFDPFSEPSCTGILGEALLRYMPDAVRTSSPDHSIAVWGADALTAAERETYSSSPCPRVGCLGMLTDRGGHILLAGAGLESCLAVFASGEWLEPERWLGPPEIRYVVGRDGRIVMRSVSGYAPESIRSARYFNKLLAPLTEFGAVRGCRFGSADCLLIDCASLVSVTSFLLFRDPGLFSDSRPVPRRMLREVARNEKTLEERRKINKLFLYQ